MRRELLLLGEMIDAAVEAQRLVEGMDIDGLADDRQRRDALLWNFTVLGKAAAQLPEGLRVRFPEVQWTQPARLRNRIVHGYWSIDLEILHTTTLRALPGFVEQLREVVEIVEAMDRSEQAD